MTEEIGKMIANVDEYKYGALLAATRPAVIADAAELERLTEEVNRLVTKGIKESVLSPEEERPKDYRSLSESSSCMMRLFATISRGS
jgi:hypothetical protein